MRATREVFLFVVFFHFLQNVAMPVVSGSHVPVAGAGQVAVGSGSALDQYLYQVPTIYSGPDVGSGHSAGLHYQRVNVGQLPVIDPIANEVLLFKFLYLFLLKQLICCHHRWLFIVFHFKISRILFLFHNICRKMIYQRGRKYIKLKTYSFM